MTAYDAENHLVGAGWNNGAPAVDYGYDAQGKRSFLWTAGTFDPWGGNATNYSVVMYSPSGQKLGTYLISVCNQGANNTTSLTICSALSTSDKYFGGRRLAVMDQLGSAGTYYPWGEAKGSTNPQDAWSYATYWRDSVSGLDYANQRYYSNTYGRFMTPDPSASANSEDPQSWNRYEYVSGDPINNNDPTGLEGGGPTDSPDNNGEGPPVDKPKLPFPTDGGSGDGGSFGLAAWKKLSADCQNALRTKFGQNASINSMLAAINRANADAATFQTAVLGTNISWETLAGIAIEESGVQDINQNGGPGHGVGVFQITVTPTSGVTAAQANDLMWASDWSAQYLFSNELYIAKHIQGLSSSQLLWMTVSSFNTGAGGQIKRYNRGESPDYHTSPRGDGTFGDKYGQTVLGLMKCFK